MARYLINCEVEGYAILADRAGVVRYADPAGRYTAFLRDLNTDPNSPPPLLSLQMVFDAPSIDDAKAVADPYIREFLSRLSLITSCGFRFRRYVHIFDWEPERAMRDAIYFSGETERDAPIPALADSLVSAIAHIQEAGGSHVVQRAIRWFANGVSSDFADDQFTFFWQTIEVISRIAKDPAPVPDQCPICRGELYCISCKSTPHHRPYPKQAIQQIFKKCITGDWETFFNKASEVRNRLVHGDDVASIEIKLKVDFPTVVDALGQVAWAALFNQFPKALQSGVLTTNTFSRAKMAFASRVQVSFKPNYDNPDPTTFPKISVTLQVSDRPTKDPVN